MYLQLGAAHVCVKRTNEHVGHHKVSEDVVVNKLEAEHRVFFSLLYDYIRNDHKCAYNIGLVNGAQYDIYVDMHMKYTHSNIMRYKNRDEELSFTLTDEVNGGGSHTNIV